MFNSDTGSSFDYDKCRDEQFQLELASDTELVAKAIRESTDKAETGDLNLPKARRVIATAFSSVREYIQSIQERPMRGRASKYLAWLRKVDTDVAAVIAIRQVLTSTSTHEAPTFQNIASAIGRQYVTEVRIWEASRINPLYVEKAKRRLDDINVTSVTHRRHAFKTIYDRVTGGLINSDLSASETIQLGKFGLEACYEAGLIELEVTGKGPKAQYLYKLDLDIFKYLLTYEESDFRHLISNDSKIMVCPPDEWTEGMGGGYLTPRRKLNQALLTGSYKGHYPKGYLKDFNDKDFPKMFRVFNYLQSIPYEFHQPTVELLARIWSKGGGVLGVPSTTFTPKPVFPFGEDWTKETATEEELKQFLTWRAATANWHYDERAWRSKLLETSQLVQGLTNLQGRPIWFPVFADSRGRIYYRGSPNPQGSQIAKAAIHFHERKPLGKRGLFWLKVHIANCYGLDDVRFEERAKWVDDNWEALERAVEAPEEHEDVWGSESPLMMFSAVYELHRALQSGSPEDYECGLPIHMDATCSGIQHFSALLRDEVGAKHVNLEDNGEAKKADIYKAVGESALRHLTNLAEAGHLDAEPWTRLGVDRDLAKRPVMTKVYGVTLLTVIRYVTDKARELYPNEELTSENFTALAKALLEGVGIALPSVVLGMSWLQSIARKSKDPDGLTWTVPSGFRVHHRYRKWIDSRINVNSSGITQVVVRESLDEINNRRSVNAISPNFIHSLDAAHVALTCDSMREQELSFLTIHDSFASHPSSMDDLHKILREEFINLYSHDILQNFKNDTGIDIPKPRTGRFCLAKVRDSEFFFS